MGTVYGPYTAEDWWVMRCMKGNIAEYLRIDHKRFEDAIMKSKDILKRHMNRTTEEEAA